MTSVDDRARRLVLVVGGGGYVGSVVVDHLLAQGYEVRVLDCFLYGNSAAVRSFLGRAGFSFVFGDLCDPNAVAKALENVTDVVLLASLVGDPISKKYPNLTSAVNLKGSQDLLRAFHGRGGGRFVFTSTCSNYGLRETDELAVEESALHPLSLYAETKVAFEQYLFEQQPSLDCDPVVLRISTAFGISPRMRFDLTVNEFAYHLARGETLDVYDKDTWRPYCHIRDIARAIQTVLEADRSLVAGEVFNVGHDDNNYTKKMIVDEITKYTNATVNYVEKGGDKRNYRVSFSKITSVLGFRPQVMVRDFVPELIEAVQSNLFLEVEHSRESFGNYVVRNPWAIQDHATE